MIQELLNAIEADKQNDLHRKLSGSGEQESSYPDFSSEDLPEETSPDAAKNTEKESKYNFLIEEHHTGVVFVTITSKENARQDPQYVVLLPPKNGQNNLFIKMALSDKLRGAPPRSISFVCNYRDAVGPLAKGFIDGGDFVESRRNVFVYCTEDQFKEDNRNHNAKETGVQFIISPEERNITAQDLKEDILLKWLEERPNDRNEYPNYLNSLRI